MQCKSPDITGAWTHNQTWQWAICHLMTNTLFNGYTQGIFQCQAGLRTGSGLIADQVSTQILFQISKHDKPGIVLLMGNDHRGKITLLIHVHTKEEGARQKTWVIVAGFCQLDALLGDNSFASRPCRHTDPESLYRSIIFYNDLYSTYI